MTRLLIPGLFAIFVSLALPALAQTTTTTPAQPQSDYDRVMKGVDATTAGVIGPQPGTPTKTITTKTVNGPFPLANTAGVGINNGTVYNNGAGYNNGMGYGGYRNGGYVTGSYPAVTIPTPTLPTNGTSTTTTTITDGTTTPAQ